MRKECFIAFKATREMREKIIRLASQYGIANISQPLTLSDFCRIAISKFMNELEPKKKEI